MLSGSGLPPRVAEVIEATNLLFFLADPEGAKTVAGQLRALTADAVAAYDKLAAIQHEHAALEQTLKDRERALAEGAAALQVKAGALEAERAAWEGQKSEQQRALATERAEHAQKLAAVKTIAAEVEIVRQAVLAERGRLNTVNAQLIALGTALGERETAVTAREEAVLAEEARQKARAARFQAAALDP